MDLVTIDTVRGLIWPTQDPAAVTPYDAMLTALITRWSDEVVALRGSDLEELERTVYLDGEDGPYLWLPHGPVSAVDSVESIAIVDDGAGGLEEEATLVPSYTYTIAGTAASGWRGLGWLEKRSGHWCQGRRNYRVTYTAGYSDIAIPPQLSGVVANEVVAEFRTMAAKGIESIEIGTYSARPILDEARRKAFESALRPYLR